MIATITFRTECLSANVSFQLKSSTAETKRTLICDANARLRPEWVCVGLRSSRSAASTPSVRSALIKGARTHLEHGPLFGLNLIRAA